MTKITREQTLQAAFLAAIRAVGLTGLKATSMFGSSHEEGRHDRATPAAIREAALREAIEAYPRGIGALVDLIEKGKGDDK